MPDPSSPFLSEECVIQLLAPPTIHIPLAPATIHICGDGNRPLVSIHPDGRTEFGEGYEPSEAARTFWEAVQHLAPAAVEKRAQNTVEAVTEALILWRDRPGGDVGLAINLSSILDTDKPEPPAATALVRVLKECDRLERAVKGNPANPDFDGAYLACLRHIRQAAGVLPADSEES
ncbi:hypothetical protein [Streptomyces sp. NPDC007074]|uniref:hypothetical protein n=1 Tax=Streptomyces sp. NPDC007074 TaxID=3156764 RepID=UPI00340BCC97